MAATIVQRVSSNAPTSTSVSVTLSAITSGNKLVAVMKENGANAVTTPSGWTHASGSPYTGGATRQLYVMWKDAGGSEPTTITFSNADANNKLLTVWEVSGLSTGAAAFAGGTANATGLTSKTLTSTGTLANAANFVVAVADQALDNGGTEAVDSGFTLRDSGTFNFWTIADKITSATTALAPTFSWATSRASIGFMAGFTVAPITIAGTRSGTATVSGAADVVSPPAATVAVASTALPMVNVWEYDTSEWRLSGMVVGYSALSCESLFLGSGSWSLTAGVNTRGMEKITESSLVTVDWKGYRWATGRVSTPKDSSDDRGMLTLEKGGETGLGLLQGVACWPDPTAGIGAQPEFGVYNDDAQTVVRSLILDHYRDRYGADISSPASPGLGDVVKIKTRFDDLLDRVVKAAKRGGIGVDVGLIDTTGTRSELKLTLYVPEDRSDVAILSHAMGTLRGWEYGGQRPAMTKAIVGGSGEGSARNFRVVTTAASVAAAARWGGHIEGFVDASDTNDTAELDQRGAEALDEALSSDTFSLTASGAPGMRIWERARLGDSVLVELATGVSATQPLNGLRLEVDDGGPVVTPIVGDAEGSNPAKQLARLVRQARRQIRTLQTTRERT